nr:mantle peroxidase-like protein [Novocrania anomala]
MADNGFLVVASTRNVARRLELSRNEVQALPDLVSKPIIVTSPPPRPLTTKRPVIQRPQNETHPVRTPRAVARFVVPTFTFGCPFEKPRCGQCTLNYRTADGSCNNLKNPLWGRANIPFLRFLPPQYDDFVDSPRTVGISGFSLPNARRVSFTVHEKSTPANQLKSLTHMLMQWGQWTDHDLTHTPTASGYQGSAITCCISTFLKRNSGVAVFPSLSGTLSGRPQCFPIEIPADDPVFKDKCMNFVRSQEASNLGCTLGYREQINQITSYIDASQIYGSSLEEFAQLRSFEDGKLKVSPGNLLPKDEINENNCVLPSPNFNDIKCFKAGDLRVNEQVVLTSMHTLWLREHNRIAMVLKKYNRHWCDEKIFQETRKIVGAMNQHITFKEWLPKIIGPDFRRFYRLNPRKFGYFTGYDSSVDATIRNVFATAAFRFGHSLIFGDIDQVNVNFAVFATTKLKKFFSNPRPMYNTDGAGSLLRGVIHEFVQRHDRLMDEQVTKFLFEDSSGSAFDLAALNIQRGRDHGTPGYGEWRQWCGLDPVTHFGGSSGGLVHHDATTRSKLQAVYNDPRDIDLFTAGVSELPVNGGVLGPTFSCIIARSFALLKFGDRFYYENFNIHTRFTPAQLRQIRKVRLSRVMCDNLSIKTIQPDVFKQPNQPGNSRRPCSSIPNWSLIPWRCRDGKWGRWGPWSPCYGNQQWRRRRCFNRDPCGKPCQGNGLQFRLCSCRGGFRSYMQPTKCGCPMLG